VTGPLPGSFSLCVRDASTFEVAKALESYEEVPFSVLDGRVLATERADHDGGHWEIADYTGQDSLQMMPSFAARPECFACFFISDSDDGELFYQTAEYVRLYRNDMSLKALYIVARPS